MRALFLKLTMVALCLVLCASINTNAEDYLVIKKKDGQSQKVPLNFNPEQIESFQVEAAPKDQGTGTEPAEESEQPEAPPQKIEPKPVEQPRPGLKKGPASMPRTQIPERRQEDDAIGVESQPLQPQQMRKPSGPVSSAPKSGNTFNVNVYKLPENAKTIPDFSALRPVKNLTCDRIDLDPARGGFEPSGISEPTDGLGLRFVGLFMVSGEGIFKWRLHSKDGARMHIDDKTLIENDGVHEASSKTGFIHLSEGVHTVIVDSFNSTGQPILKLFVQPPSGTESIFDTTQGLAGWKEPEKPYDVLWGQVFFVPKGNYPEGPDFSQLTPIGRVIAPELNISGDESFPNVPGRRDMLGVRYQGYFNVDGAGIFAFRLASDYFARLTIGKFVIAEINAASRSDQGKLGWAFLQKGSYPINIDYFHPQGPPRLQLSVTTPTKDEEMFTPAKPLEGFSAEGGQMSLIPAFVYFLKPNTRKIPNYNKLSPAGMFFTKSIDFSIDRGTEEFPGLPKRQDWFGLRFYVKFSLSGEESGVYKFRIVCKDAARLIVDKIKVIEADAQGNRPVEQTGSITLGPEAHEMFLDYLQTTGPNAIQLFITPPGGVEKVFAYQ